MDVESLVDRFPVAYDRPLPYSVHHASDVLDDRAAWMISPLDEKRHL